MIAKFEHNWPFLRENLRAEMKRKGFSALRLAKEIGRDGTYIRDFLIGKKVSMAADAIPKIEQALGVKQGSLMGIISAPPPVQSSPALPEGGLWKILSTLSPADLRDYVKAIGTIKRIEAKLGFA